MEETMTAKRILVPLDGSESAETAAAFAAMEMKKWEQAEPNASGSISAADIGLVKSKSGTALPPK